MALPRRPQNVRLLRRRSYPALAPGPFTLEPLPRRFQLEFTTPVSLNGNDRDMQIRQRLRSFSSGGESESETASFTSASSSSAAVVGANNQHHHHNHHGNFDHHRQHPTQHNQHSHTTTQETAPGAHSKPKSRPQPSAPELEPVKFAIHSILAQSDYVNGSASPAFVRLAWQVSGTYCAMTNTGGSNGADMRYAREDDDAATAELEHARQLLEPIKEQFPWLSYADLWTLAATVALREMGGPDISWRAGRAEFVSADETEEREPPEYRLVDGTQGADHLREVFGRMGLGRDHEIVLLAAANTLGRCYKDRSGSEGRRTSNPARFSNEYYRVLMKNEWRHVVQDNGQEQYVSHVHDRDEEVKEGEKGKEKSSETRELMMLPTDMSLLSDPGFRPWVERYAEDQELFFEQFTEVFDRLLELGIRRDQEGNAISETPAEEETAGSGRSDFNDAPPAHAPAYSHMEQVRLEREAGSFRDQIRKFWRRREGAKL